jgi:transposase-like protein
MRLNDLAPSRELQPQGIDELSSSQQEVILALLVCRTFTAAAKKAGVDRTTVYRWIRQDNSFRRELAKARREALAETTARLQRLTKTAVIQLGKIIKDDEAPAASRVTGIRTTLDFAYRAVELEDIQERLVEVEDSIKQYGPRRSTY